MDVSPSLWVSADSKFRCLLKSASVSPKCSGGAITPCTRTGVLSFGYQFPGSCDTYWRKDDSIILAEQHYSVRFSNLSFPFPIMASFPSVADTPRFAQLVKASDKYLPREQRPVLARWRKSVLSASKAGCLEINPVRAPRAVSVQVHNLHTNLTLSIRRMSVRWSSFWRQPSDWKVRRSLGETCASLKLELTALDLFPLDRARPRAWGRQETSIYVHASSNGADGIRRVLTDGRILLSLPIVQDSSP